jgi:hypothetical protein
LARPLAIFAVALAWPAALAHADDSAGADVLYQQGKSLMTDGKAIEACPKFEASYKLEKKLGTLLNWADCLEKTNKIASAYARFDEAFEWATREGDQSRIDFATSRRDPLKARLPRLRLSVKLGHEKLAVFTNDEAVDESHFGVAVPIDPGVVTVSVRRGDDPLEERKVEAKEGAESVIELDLEAIATAHPKKVAIIPAPKTQRNIAFVVGGVGLVGLVVFGALEGVAYQEKSNATSLGRCRFDDGSNRYECTPKGFASEKRAGDFAEAGQWTGVASAVVVAVGITLLATAPRARAAPTEHAFLAPFISPDGSSGGLTFGGDL